jgi:hypothetical protein
MVPTKAALTSTEKCNARLDAPAGTELITQVTRLPGHCDCPEEQMAIGETTTEHRGTLPHIADPETRVDPPVVGTLSSIVMTPLDASPGFASVRV